MSARESVELRGRLASATSRRAAAERTERHLFAAFEAGLDDGVPDAVRAHLEQQWLWSQAVLDAARDDERAAENAYVRALVVEHEDRHRDALHGRAPLGAVA